MKNKNYPGYGYSEAFFRYIGDVGKLEENCWEKNLELFKEIEKIETGLKNVLLEFTFVIHYISKIKSKLESSQISLKDVLKNKFDSETEELEKVKFYVFTDMVVDLNEKREALWIFYFKNKNSKKTSLEKIQYLNREIISLFKNYYFSREIFQSLSEVFNSVDKFYLSVGKKIFEQCYFFEDELFMRNSGMIKKYLSDRVKIEKIIIEANLKLVLNIAISKSKKSIQYDVSDLVQAGNLGLKRAVEKFNYRNGYLFSTYAKWWVISMINRESNNGLIHIPAPSQEVIFRIKKESKMYYLKNGKEISFEELEEIIKIDADILRSLYCGITYISSISTYLSDEGGAFEIQDKNLQSDCDATSQVLNIELSDVIYRLLNVLTLKQRRVLELRFGIGEKTSHTLQEIGDIFGVSRERIRQIEQIALGRLKKEAKNRQKLVFSEFC